MPEELVLLRKKIAISKKYMQIHHSYDSYIFKWELSNYWRDAIIEFDFDISRDLERCKKDLEKLKDNINKNLENENLNLDIEIKYILIKQFFTDSQIDKFSYKEVRNPYFTRAKPKIVYSLNEVMQVVRSKNLELKSLSKLNFDAVEVSNQGILQILHHYFNSYILKK